MFEGPINNLSISTKKKRYIIIDMPLICVSDNKSPVTAVKSTKSIEDKQLYIDVCTLRQMLQKGEISEIKLTTSKDQLADCLTKSTASPDNLLRVLLETE